MNWQQLFQQFGFPLVALGIGLESMGIPAPGETILLVAAAAAAAGNGNIVWVIVAAAAGAIIGDNVAFTLGRRYGRSLIARIPFDVPSDPVFAARSETFDNSFFEYSIPEAVLRFRQGFGRLIRRKSDEGVVVILDKRILTKRYGEKFLEALPECTVIRQRTERLGELTQRWFNRQRRG